MLNPMVVFFEASMPRIRRWPFERGIGATCSVFEKARDRLSCRFKCQHAEPVLLPPRLHNVRHRPEPPVREALLVQRGLLLPGDSIAWQSLQCRLSQRQHLWKWIISATGLIRGSFPWRAQSLRLPHSRARSSVFLACFST
jgi:hypothetical protein